MRRCPKQSFIPILLCVFSVFVLTLCPPCQGQTNDAALGGVVEDRSGAVIPNVEIRVTSVETGITRETTTNGAGLFNVPGLNPGKYSVHVEHPGFADVEVTDITLNVASNRQLEIKLAVGKSQQTVTVNGSGLTINTTDASVSTVVDRNFVESMPLNGRSFQSLILLAPGVVTNTPQNGASTGVQGEFSINGQRADANYYTVDGVSASNAVIANGVSGAGNAGALPAATALGSTQALVSVDALQEFRIDTSTYSAQSGRQPGGQIQFETRSGTNNYHGTAFDYLRNNIFDANNWFNDYATPPLAKPAERQNDFGGVLGGPVTIPKLYSGKDRTFFFFSYEGLRLSQAEPATISYVPSNNPASTSPYGNLRNTAPVALQPLLNAFPLPNCTVAQDPQCIDDSVEGLSPYLVSTSLPSSIDAISVRGDHVVSPWLRVFFRYSRTESSAVSSITTIKEGTEYSTSTYTLGADATFFGKLSNQFRLNYSPTDGIVTDQSTTLGGGSPVDIQALQGLPSNLGFSSLLLLLTNESANLDQGRFGTRQHQWNLVDTVGWLRGRHDFRAGIDYRRTTSYINAGSLTESPFVSYQYLSAAQIQSNNDDSAVVENIARQDPAFTNLSTFVQDEWRVKPHLSLSLGVRWEINPAPQIVSGAQQRTINGNFNDQASLTLAPAGTALYKTTYYNFAPRLGMAATLHGGPGHETVLRAGSGVYYDLGQQLESLFGGFSPGAGNLLEYGPGNNISDASFPLPLNLINVPVSLSLTPPYGDIFLTSQHLQLPYTYQWNAALEQSLGSDQSVTLGYVGSNGRRLIQRQEINSLNPTFTFFERYDNGLSSSYNALQLQYKRRLSHGLQVLAAYTWSHGIDFGSNDVGFLPYERGNSDFDVRNNFNAAVSYDVPSNYSDAWERRLLSQWGGDLRFTARTAFPVEIEGPELLDPATGAYSFGFLNYNRGVATYLNRPGLPGGRVINSEAFSAPLAGQIGNSPRNFLRGFGENEVNLAIRREFPLYEQVHLLFRAESFNILNHPNFGSIDVTCGNSSAGETCTNLTFGQATSTLASSLGGLTPIYQQGGPRSLQFALKLVF